MSLLERSIFQQMTIFPNIFVSSNGIVCIWYGLNLSLQQSLNCSRTASAWLWHEGIRGGCEVTAESSPGLTTHRRRKDFMFGGLERNCFSSPPEYLLAKAELVFGSPSVVWTRTFLSLQILSTAEGVGSSSC